MADKVYNIVPNPDTVIVLRNPLQDFAVWEKPASDAATETEIQNADDATKTPLELPGSIEPPAPEAPAQPSLFGGDTVADRNVIDSQQLTSAAARNGKARQLGAVAREVPAGGIHYYCSAAHLKLASKTFEKALSGNWAESVRKDDDDRYYIIVEDWDEVALLTLLNIIHLRNDQVPRRVNIEMLAKMATLVDYYQCLEATALCTEKWTNGLISDYIMPTIYGRDLMLWLCVACVFRLPYIFQRATMAAINTGTDGSLRTMGLPIPQGVSDCVEKKRRELIAALVCEVYTLLDNHRSVDYICPTSEDDSFLCGSVMLGALTKEVEAMGLAPRPSEPFDNLSLNDLHNKISDILAVYWRTPSSRNYDSDYLHPCNLRDQMDDMRETHITSAGLCLDECGLCEVVLQEEVVL